MKAMGFGVDKRMLLALLGGILCIPLHAASNQKQNDPGPKPDVRVPVGPLGYVAPNSSYLVYRYSSISLDFIDNDHLLFTFHMPGLMKRMPGEPASDEDQTIRADVLELPSGKVLNQTDWRMHDHMRYLWRLGDGQFLVRQRNVIFSTDKTLQLLTFLHSEEPLESVQISPDRKLIALETEGKKTDRQALASAADDMEYAAPDSKPVQVYVVQTENRSIIAHAETLNAVEIPMLGEGHLQAVAGKKDKWLVRYLPFKGEQRELIEVESSCHPSEEPVSYDVALIFTCPRSGNDHLVSAVNLEGKTLWQQRWESRYIWPTFQLAQNGTRFAYSSLQVSHPVGTMDPVDEASIVSQMIGVFDTATGQLRLAKNATPILSAGQNYALSPDGSKFAILREGAIEIYDLPPVSMPGQ